MDISTPVCWVGADANPFIEKIFPKLAANLDALKFPAVTLTLPEIRTDVPGENGDEDVMLRFVLDTGANYNTIDLRVASELDLMRVGALDPGLGAAGPVGGGDTFLLGDCLVGDLRGDNRSTLMPGLTASAIPLAYQPTEGVLSWTFLTSLRGGFEFRWTPVNDEPASLTVFAEVHGTDKVIQGLSAIAVTELPDSGLPCVMLVVNGVEIPALLDTGSPITVLNPAAATAAEIQVESAWEAPTASSNPLAALSTRLQAVKSLIRGDVLVMPSSNGLPLLLERARASNVTLGAVQFESGSCKLHVGELPGFETILRSVGAPAAPAAILGLDLLRQRPRVVYQNAKLYI
eukprot:gnl/TRDRNA2_/TRDRNA2_165466_c0_seq1.p1 gnl/TRDRNA2_/TRDRNA2_165466_c0~~gnl/TRDRNA2_/TRDRNA2_165466_c0_seq1.p1  ORF type:complete len:387 (-),score=43.89 gnl/TRDRNA2_/TRDRNA2_165466_c0_seq1:7-1047(-)